MPSANSRSGSCDRNGKPSTPRCFLGHAIGHTTDAPPRSMTVVKKRFAVWLKRSPDTTMLKLTAPVLRNAATSRARLQTGRFCALSPPENNALAQPPRSSKAAFWRFSPVQRTDLEGQQRVDIVEKLEFLRRSQFRGLPEASTENSLGVRLSDRSCHVRRSNRRCCGNYRRRQHYMRSSEIFAAPQFPSFSTVST
jgi:hypothetical protein